MRRLLIISLSIALCAITAKAQDYKDLDSLLNIYTASMRQESVETKNQEVDFMISAANDSLVQQHIALSLFDYYKESPLMGEEAVAVHIYDRWFANGRVKMRGEFDKMDAQLFANFNRHTLIGDPAPIIKLRKPCLGKKAIPEYGRPALIWFYDTSCGKCQMEAKVLPGVLEAEADFPLTVYAVYCGSDKKAWKEFRESLKVYNPNVHMVHLWDPEIKSDYLRLYGVMSTPKMYMTDPVGNIIGRRLEVESLPEIFDVASALSDYYLKAKQQ